MERRVTVRLDHSLKSEMLQFHDNNHSANDIDI